MRLVVYKGALLPLRCQAVMSNCNQNARLRAQKAHIYHWVHHWVSFGAIANTIAA